MAGDGFDDDDDDDDPDEVIILFELIRITWLYNSIYLLYLLI